MRMASLSRFVAFRMTTRPSEVKSFPRPALVSPNQNKVSEGAQDAQMIQDHCETKTQNKGEKRANDKTQEKLELGNVRIRGYAL